MIWSMEIRRLFDIMEIRMLEEHNADNLMFNVQWEENE